MSGTLRLRGATSGYSELQAPAVAADQTFILPTAGGTLLTTDSPVPKLTLELGSASQPSLTFEGDTDTGLYSSGTNTLNLVTGGNNRLTIDSSGNVGIGTTSPSQPLTVGGVARFENFIEFAGSISTPGTAAAIYRPADNNLAFSTASTERMRIDSSGNVGINNTNPQYPLVVGSGTDDILNVDTASAGSGVALRATDDGRTDYEPLGLAAEYINFYTRTGIFSSAERMRIDSSGRLLVGTSSASNNTGVLVVQGYAGVTAGEGTLDLVRGNNVTAAVQGLGSINFGHSQYQGASIDALSAGAWTESSSHPANLSFSTTADGASSPTERMRIDSSGNVGIGTQSPTTLLHLESSTSGVIINAVSTATSGEAGVFITGKNSSGASRTGIFKYDSADLFRIGTNAGVDIRFETNDVERIRIRSDGRMLVPGVYAETTGGAENVNVQSDGLMQRSVSSIKYKKDVETLEDSYADALLDLRPVWYKSKCASDNPDWGYWGFIAEELAEIDPRLVIWKTEEVTADEDGNQVKTACDPEPEGVQYSRFVPHLLNLIKRQQTAIETLETKVAALEAAMERIETLEQRLSDAGIA